MERHRPSRLRKVIFRAEISAGAFTEGLVGGIKAPIPLTRLGPSNVTFAFSEKETNIFQYHPGGVDAEVGISDSKKLTCRELPSVMSSTVLTLMLTDVQRVTLRAAEGVEELLLICPPTHSYSLWIHVNSQKKALYQ